MLSPELSREVQMQFLRPAQLEARAKAFPVVYVPFGPIEWHGRHLPLGTDALKAHGVLCKTAERFGGVVYPPLFLHDGWGQQHLIPALSALFERLKAMGFRVIVAVSGHNVREMIAMMDAALQPVVADGTVRGVALWEVTLSQGEESNTDHAAKWETSDMLFLYPDRVNLAELGEGEINLDAKPPSGIAGLDPRKHASTQVGARCIELAAEAIGRKAQELLASLPEEYRSFGLEAIEPSRWWIV
ncbi:MAG: hypothetical protein KatS3mg115_0425 [Candidatus Poribacteria bacterium]|nr:MAG: hypothetical protein KatS3mg115_0425 [Candidatus Poribacteria bacterium]